MRWPFVLRSYHEGLFSILQANLEARLEVIEYYKKVILDKNCQIVALEAALTGPKCNDYTSADPKDEKKSKSGPKLPYGRGGWRTRARILSESTAPKPADSIQALEQRVQKEGGTI